MRRDQLIAIRRHFGKTQREMAQVLGVSSKAVQSFEQGWRKIPVSVERQLLLMLALKSRGLEKGRPCWITLRCPVDRRQNCPAWQFEAGRLCWFVNGTICEGSPQRSWNKKMQICRKCKVYRSTLLLKAPTIVA